MVTHFDPYRGDDDFSEHAWCGTVLGYQYNSSNDWGNVDCKRCLANRVKFDKEVKLVEKSIVDQMKLFVEFNSSVELTDPNKEG